MNQPPSLFLLPKPIGALLSRLPAYPGSVLLVAALNAGVARQLPPDVGERLLHKHFRIEVRDARASFDFTWNGSGFAARLPDANVDLCISASAHDFVRLARRQEDPDTLFFSRRLSVQGDTELGLVVKNTLDALELPVLDIAQLTPRLLLACLAPLRPGRARAVATDAIDAAARP